MKTKQLTQIIAMSLTVILFLATGCATTKNSAPTATQMQEQKHNAHHPEIASQKNATGSTMTGKDGMMGDGMMNHCMTMHKDGNMCDYKMMENCQKNMNKQECMKIMAEAKAQNETTNKQK